MFVCACKRPEAPAPQPSILLVTLDTTRADAIGPDAKGVNTPSYNALAARGSRFRWAYTPVPQTLPAHTSMLTGLYPAGHGVHENSRHVPEDRALISERLRAVGYRTAAFVSSFAVARQFGLARGFDEYDDDFGADRVERTAGETTDRAIAFLDQPSSAPLFLWVHYYDPHWPYTPPEPFRTQYAAQPYYGEVAYMDQQLGRLVDAFQKKASGDKAIVIVGDHGEGLGEHGEEQHGNLLYQATVHVPMIVIGPGVATASNDTPFSTRHVFDLILGFAHVGQTFLSGRPDKNVWPTEVVAGEAMQPFLEYGWQPQVMAVQSRYKTILAGSTEVYDVVNDPGETRNLAATASLSREVRATLRDYPLPTSQPPNLGNDEERKKLASLGYVASDVKPLVRKDAPRPADMASLFPIIDQASILFVQERYTESIPLLEEVAKRDPHNLDAVLKLASAHSALGHDQQARDAFKTAQAIAPDSDDVRLYTALHDARGEGRERAAAVLEQFPDRMPALQALASIREQQHRWDDALALLQKIDSLGGASPREVEHIGELAMQVGQTPAAIAAFERARKAEGAAFHHDLELGVLYLASHDYEHARQALDRVPASHPDYAMALFKRAQVSVLLHEPDAASRIATAKAHANAMTRELIARERLFQQ